MTLHKTFLALALVIATGLFSQTVRAEGEEGHDTVHPEQQKWSFAGPFGTYDTNQIRRGFQIYREVCSSCHGQRLLAFRNLEDPNGPAYSEEQVKALAATFTVNDPDVEGGTRPATAADHWPPPFATEQEARAANNGAYPPDMSVLAKARGIHMDFPWWVFNYFTAYQEGGPDYIYNFLVNFTEPPADVEVPPGQYYNAFLGSSVSMPDVLSDGLVDYEGEDAVITETEGQYARDVSAYLMWAAEPYLPERKATGFRVLVFLLFFAVLLWLTKQRIWAPVH